MVVIYLHVRDKMYAVGDFLTENQELWHHYEYLPSNDSFLCTLSFALHSIDLLRRSWFSTRRKAVNRKLEETIGVGRAGGLPRNVTACVLSEAHTISECSLIFDLQCFIRRGALFWIRREVTRETGTVA